jgi:tRNA A-37 threonylcarbamoyl transferase component Bud32
VKTRDNARETLRRAVELQVIEPEDVSSAGSLLQDPRELMDALVSSRVVSRAVLEAIEHLVELRPGRRRRLTPTKSRKPVALDGGSSTLAPQRAEPAQAADVPQLGGGSETLAPSRSDKDEGSSTIAPADPSSSAEGWVNLNDSGDTMAGERSAGEAARVAEAESEETNDLSILDTGPRRAIEAAAFCRIGLRLGKLTREQIEEASGDPATSVEDKLLEMGAIDQAVAMEIFALRQEARTACSNCFGLLADGADPGKPCPTCGQASTTGATSVSRVSTATLADGMAGQGIEGFPGSGGTFAGYELLERIAEGGMGVVFKARQTKLNRIVALKVMRGGSLANRERRRRFKQEAESAAALRHPCIVPVHEIDEVAGYPFYTMEFVEGVTLESYVVNQKLEPRRVTAIVRGIADAVQHFHLRGVIHRDLKPGNILVGTDGVPKIIDFGIAKKLVPDSDSSTIEGEVLGTPYYMSPEQAAGRVTEVDTRTDVYALGAILYELLTGAAPYKGLRQARLVAAIQEEDPEPIRAKNPNVEADLESIVMKAMAKERERRYQSAAELAADLERYEKNLPITARPATLGYRIRKYVKRRLPAVIATAVVIVVLGAVSAVAIERRAVTRHEVERLLATARDKTLPFASRESAVNEALGKDDGNETARALREALAAERVAAEASEREQQMAKLQEAEKKAAAAEAEAKAERANQELARAKAADQARLEAEKRAREEAERRARELLDRASAKTDALDAVPDLQEALVLLPKSSGALRATVENKKIDLELLLARENVSKNQSGLARFWLGDARRLEASQARESELKAVEDDLKKLESGEQELKAAQTLVASGSWLAARGELARLAVLGIDRARYATETETVDKACAQIAQQLVAEGRDKLRAGDPANGMAKAVEALQFATNESVKALVSDCEREVAQGARRRAAEGWKRPETQKTALVALAQAAELVQDPTLKALLETERAARARLLEERSLAGLAFVPAVPDLGVAACFIEKTEVTNSEYKQFVDAGGYDMAELWKGVPAEVQATFRDGCPGGACGHKGPRSWTNGGYGDPANADRPVRGITVHEARAFAAWLSKTKGGTWRLPRDREWEVAAGFDPATQRLLLYPWGDEWRPDALPAASDLPRPTGTSPADVSPLGVADAGGNVMEWVEQKDKDPGTKGTSFAASEAVSRHFALVRSTGSPGATPPAELVVWIGFRLVREIEGK